VDARAFKIICTIFAEGDVAKASRELKMRDSTLRDEIKAWKGRGKAYETMLDLVEWRKSVGRHVEIPLNDAILLERSKSVDHPALLSDVLDGLLSMTEGNWEDKVEELAEVLRQHVPR
jgi:predicted component of type VI protein secretion system